MFYSFNYIIRVFSRYSLKMVILINEQACVSRNSRQTKTSLATLELFTITLSLISYVGLPVADESPVDKSAVGDAANVAEETALPETKGHSMDDVMPGTKPPPTTSVLFVDVPEHTETELGSSVLLACRTANPVAECQWSWQPLPPVHLPLPDVSESPPVSTSKHDRTVSDATRLIRRESQSTCKLLR